MEPEISARMLMFPFPFLSLSEQQFVVGILFSALRVMN
jgi:hypothetical protein